MIETKRITDITINHRRPVARATVAQLCDSIQQVGLLNPITVTECGVLVAGLHRLEACRELGWAEIKCNVIREDEAELAEIDENLIRNELNTMERGELLARRKAIYEERNPETKAGTAGANASNAAQGREHASEIISFATDTAAKTGLSPRSVQQEVQIANKITPEVKDAIRETPLADKKTELLRLARMEPAQQMQTVQKIASGEIKSVKEADPELKRIDREHHIQNMVLKSLDICATAGIGDYDESVEIYLRWGPDWTPQECIDRADASITHLEKLKAAFQNARKIRVVK